MYFSDESYIGGGERYPLNLSRGIVESSGGAYSVDLISFGPKSRTYPLAPGPDRPRPGRGPAADQPARRRLVGAARRDRRGRPRPRPPGLYPLLRGRLPRRQAAGQADRRHRPRRDHQHARDLGRQPGAGRPHHLQLEVRRLALPDQHADHRHQGGVDGAHFTPPRRPAEPRPGPLRRPAPAPQGDRPAHHRPAPRAAADRLRAALSARILRGAPGARRRQGRDLRHRRRRRRRSSTSTGGPGSTSCPRSTATTTARPTSAPS